jgi:hypothetical protein
VPLTQRGAHYQLVLPDRITIFQGPIELAYQTPEAIRRGVKHTVIQDADLLTTFLLFCAFLAGFAVWDTLVLDLLIFCKITPRFIIIDGTNREDYANLKYHLRSGAKGLVLSLAFSGFLAVVL